VQDEEMNKNNTTQNVFGDTQDDKVVIDVTFTILIITF